MTKIRTWFAQSRSTVEALYSKDRSGLMLDYWQEIDRRLRYALERNEFSLQYQPRADIQSGQICGLEALLRWQQPELGVVAPMDFIPVLEETGLIIAVGEWVIRTACTYAQTLREAGMETLRVAVNLSARQ